MINIDHIMAWLRYMDMTVTDVVLFIGLFLLFVLGVFNTMKGKVTLGVLQIFLTLLTPYMICMFINIHKPFWQLEKKTWMTLFAPHTLEGSSYIAIMLLVLFPLWIIITFKNINNLKTKK